MKRNEKGIATIESVLLLSIFVVFMTYTIGMFGVIHTGILNSISARAYAFETFRNRANVNYFRDDFTAGQEVTNYMKFGFRAHGITTEDSTESHWYVTAREITKGRDVATVAQRPAVGTLAPLYDTAPNDRELGAVNPVYIKTVYGVCLNAACGGSQGGS